MRFFQVAEGLRRHPWFGDAFGLFAFLSALFLRFAVHNTLPPGFPYLTFFPAVIITTFLGGIRPGVTCAVLSGLASWYWFIGVPGTFDVSGATLLALAFYIFIVVVDIALIHGMTLAMRRLQHQQTISAQLYDQQRTMFQELQHRVANNMQFVAALLTLQKRKVGDDPTAALTALDDARLRLETISRIHRRLYDPATIHLPMGQYLQELCSDLLDASGARNIVCLVDIPAVSFDLTRLTTLSLLVVEVVTNALKHAFPDGRKGTITITLQNLDPEQFVLTIRDNGRGLPADFDPAASRSLGFKIVQRLAAQLNGQIAYKSDGGTQARLTFAAHPAEA